MDTTLQLHIGLPEGCQEAAAKLYYTAFRQKLHPIFRDESKGLAVLERSLSPACAIAALIGDKLVGVAGFKTMDSSFVDIRPATMTRTFGYVGGWIRLLALSLFSRNAEPRVLLMDGIVVDPQSRSMGVGSQLLDAVVELAKQRGYEQVRLDVVDTNPRARSLYERKGFVAAQTKRYPGLVHVFGFSASTTLFKSVHANPTARTPEHSPT
ncbi:MAG TPA: GNAT family N-acetyltransferase [Candidatus Limnocylindrales bacterium]|nr:GNAT family N-acetyltransferase [Candidatus Limnocylindrales bacterium]